MHETDKNSSFHIVLLLVLINTDKKINVNKYLMMVNLKRYFSAKYLHVRFTFSYFNALLCDCCIMFINNLGRSVSFIFLLSWLVMIVVMLLFVSGGFSYTDICRPAMNPQPNSSFYKVYIFLLC